MLVYRYERPVGRYRKLLGPYGEEASGASFCHRIQMAHANSSQHPPPRWDFDSYPPKAYRYGCASLELLEAWFAGFHDELAALGFVIVAYEVSEAAVMLSKSGLQLAFKREGARRVQTGIQRRC